MEIIKENWILVILALLFLGMAVGFIMYLYHTVDLWIYEYKIYRRNGWYERNRRRQESQTKKMKRIDDEKSERNINFREEKNEEINFVIPGFKIYKVKLMNN